MTWSGIVRIKHSTENDIFRKETDENSQPLIKKYGASTTWIGKLIYRLDSRRNGGCPILAVGIGKECVEGYGRFVDDYKKLTSIYER